MDEAQRLVDEQSVRKGPVKLDDAPAEESIESPPAPVDL